MYYERMTHLPQDCSKKEKELSWFQDYPHFDEMMIFLRIDHLLSQHRATQGECAKKALFGKDATNPFALNDGLSALAFEQNKIFGVTFPNQQFYQQMYVPGKRGRPRRRFTNSIKTKLGRFSLSLFIQGASNLELMFIKKYVNFYL